MKRRITRTNGFWVDLFRRGIKFHGGFRYGFPGPRRMAAPPCWAYDSHVSYWMLREN